MLLCYLDESGTSAIPGNTSHFILAGISIPVEQWKACDSQISNLKGKWQIGGVEIHTAWMRRPYIEQRKIANFEKLSFTQRRQEVIKYRKSEFFRLQKGKPKPYHQAKKNYKKTEDYIHLTFDERVQVLVELSEIIGNWDFARLFAECIDKVYFDPSVATTSIDEQSFEQIVSRFEQYLQITSNSTCTNMGMLIHDNNPTVSKKLTDLMVKFHEKGTLWTALENTIETPLFVDSQLTSMVQVADLCSYAIRRYLENGETELFNEIYKRADRKRVKGKVIGVRHFSELSCKCLICESRR